MKETIEQYKVLQFGINDPLLTLQLPRIFEQFVNAANVILGLEYAIENPTIENNLKFIQLVDITLLTQLKTIEDIL